MLSKGTFAYAFNIMNFISFDETKNIFYHIYLWYCSQTVYSDYIYYDKRGFIYIFLFTN